ncbi:hypothetical protein [Candidatus Pelagibacter sp.]|uniref:hypothetical protein n=1 Tax=Candidatus Pelagibacter sp. TaxID=2024849 RepID=UPI003D0C2369
MFKSISTLNNFFVFFISLVTVLGFIFSYLNFNFSIYVVILSFILSLASIKYTDNFYKINFNLKLNKLYFLILIIILLIIYINYSPIIEIRQDPSIYTYRAYLFVNTGLDHITYNFTDAFFETFKEFNNGYGKILNGTSLINNNLQLDFFPGPSYLMASFGIFFKNITFYSLTLISITSAISTYILILRLSESNIVSFFLTLSIFLSPLFTWFFRSPYSEPIGYLATINIFLFLYEFFNDKKNKNNYLYYFIIFNLLFFFTYLIRIDSWFIIFLSIILISIKNLNLAIFLACTSFIFQLFVSNYYQIYFNRVNINIFNSFLNYSLIFVIFNIFFIQIVLKYKKIEIFINNYFFQNKIVKKLFLLIGFFFIYFLIFRDEFTSSFEKKLMHGKIINTNNEFIFDNLTLIFPNLIIVLGIFGLILGIFKFKFQKNLFLIFIFILLTLFSVLFLDIRNSPQLYWGYRRFIPIVIPCLIIGVCFFHYRLKLLKLFSLVIFFLTVYLQINSNQIFHKDFFFLSEMKNLDKSLALNDDIFQQYINYSILFNSKDKYPISSLISFYSLKPISYKNLDQFSDLTNKTDFPYLVATKKNNFDNLNCDYLTDLKYNYVRLGENYNSIPKTIYNKNYSFNLYLCQ